MTWRQIKARSELIIVVNPLTIGYELLTSSALCCDIILFLYFLSRIKKKLKLRMSPSLKLEILVFCMDGTVSSFLFLFTFYSFTSFLLAAYLKIVLRYLWFGIILASEFNGWIVFLDIFFLTIILHHKNDH